tara:strand:+ start:5709 stop:6002 length:294 start_codon:yes stop_codon:yes gene_type:complete
VDVLVEEFFITETWKGISVKKSLHQSRVYVKNAEGKFVEYGLLGHQAMMLSGLAGVPNEIGIAVAEACSKKVGKKVTFVGAPLVDEPEEHEEEESEE